MTATAEFVVPRSIPMMGPFTLPLSALVSSAYPRRKCDVKGARYADDLKMDVARGTACFDVSLDARVMGVEELRLTFRMSLEESMMAVLTHYDTRNREKEGEVDEEVDGEMDDAAQDAVVSKRRRRADEVFAHGRSFHDILYRAHMRHRHSRMLVASLLSLELILTMFSLSALWRLEDILDR